VSSYPPYGTPPPATARPLGAGMAIAALVLGILAVLLCWTVVGGVLFGLIAVVLGAVASGRARRRVATGRGMAIAGIVLGLLGLVLSVGLVFIGVSLFNSSGGKTLTECLQNAQDDQAKIDKCREEFQRDLEKRN
jgi:uncharacterized membrane protein